MRAPRRDHPRAIGLPVPERVKNVPRWMRKGFAQMRWVFSRLEDASLRNRKGKANRSILGKRTSLKAHMKLGPHSY